MPQHALLCLLLPCFPLLQDAAHVGMLMAHFEELQDCLPAPSGQEQEQDGEAGEGQEEDGSDTDASTPFAAELRVQWWQEQTQAQAQAEGRQAQQQQQGGSPGGSGQAAGADGVSAAAAAGEAADQPGSSPGGGGAGHAAAAAGQPGGAPGNPRDRIFELVLPSDWQLEAGEPPGLACTLFRYQRRCLSWLKWRESLGGPGSSGGGGAGGANAEGGDKEHGSHAAAAAAAKAADHNQPAAAAAAPPAAAPDAHSAKAALPATNLEWQPVVLPSGLRVYYNPVEGCVRRQPVTPPLPEVPGGLLCDEMGLGEWAVRGGRWVGEQVGEWSGLVGR